TIEVRAEGVLATELSAFSATTLSGAIYTVTATWTYDDEIYVYWPEPDPWPDGDFLVERQTDGGVWEPVASPSDFSYLDDSVSIGSDYLYRITPVEWWLEEDDLIVGAFAGPPYPISPPVFAVDGDADGDGILNGQEYELGTNPGGGDASGTPVPNPPAEDNLFAKGFVSIELPAPSGNYYGISGAVTHENGKTYGIGIHNNPSSFVKRLISWEGAQAIILAEFAPSTPDPNDPFIPDPAGQVRGATYSFYWRNDPMPVQVSADGKVALPFHGFWNGNAFTEIERNNPEADYRIDVNDQGTWLTYSEEGEQTKLLGVEFAVVSGEGLAMNNQHEVVGRNSIPGSFQQWVYSEGTKTNLSDDLVFASISDAGHYVTLKGKILFLNQTSGDGPIPLPIPIGFSSASVNSVNSLGHVLGFVQDFTSTGASDHHAASHRPVLWSPDAKGVYQVRFLDDFLDASELRYEGVHINNAGLITGTEWKHLSDDDPTAYAKPVILIPAELAVDANRDGTIVHEYNQSEPENEDLEFDLTTESEPYRFWLNDDDDRNNEDHPGSTILDSANDIIESERDLEDFTRLQIYIGGLHSSFADGTYQIGLKWKGTTSAAIKVYQSIEADGGTLYLEDTTKASEQISGGYQNTKGHIQGAEAVLLQGMDFTGMNENNPYVHLLFEGVTEGKGELIVTVHDSSGAEIGQGPGVWLDLKDIEKMYEFGGAVVLDGVDPPYERETNLSFNGIGFTTGSTITAPWDEEPFIVVYLHGFNTLDDKARNQLETLFKRLTHRGYKGRVCGFRWDTLTDATDPENVFNSEWFALKEGQALRDYAASLKERLSGYSLNLAAYSYGGAILASSINRGVPADNALFIQCAVSGSMFDPNLAFVQDNDREGPDLAINGGYRGWIDSSSVIIHNFWLETDIVLGGWSVFQEFKPHAPLLADYSYGFNASDQRSFISYSGGPLQNRDTFDEYESMAYVAETRTLSLGATGDANGFVLTNFDFGDLGYNTTEHGGFLSRRIQDNTGEFYN
ncbi:MAG: hypothetical protein AAFY98_11860, partial [Verrucomicrobiota bacterium]